MKIRTTHSLVVLAVLAACGGGGGDDPPAAAAPPPAAKPSPAPAATPPSTTPAPPTAPPPVTAPVPTPVAQRPPTEAPPPVGNPVPAAPPSVPQPPAQAPAPAGPTLAGADFAVQMATNTGPWRGGPNYVYEKGYSMTNPGPKGAIYSYQQTWNGTYTYRHGQREQGYSPYWYFPTLNMSLEMSYQDKSIWFGPTMQVNIEDGQGGYAQQITLTRPEGGFTVNPDDRLPQDTASITQWTAPGTPYYVQLQTGMYEGRIRNCWHFRLPGGFLRRGCILWMRNPFKDDPQYNTGWVQGGEYVDDDSHPQYGVSIFESLYNYAL